MRRGAVCPDAVFFNAGELREKKPPGSPAVDASVRLAYNQPNVRTWLRRNRVRIRISSVYTVLSLVCLLVPAGPIASQDAQEESVAPAVPAEVMPVDAVGPAAPSGQPMPPIVPDTGIFKRTPVVDGLIETGEWDVFYTFDRGGWEVTTFADWDSAKLYVAARSSKPFDLLVLLDADADGWLHGEDNYEFRAVRGDDGAVALSICRYDSRGAVAPTAVPVAPHEAAMVRMASGEEDGYVLEMSVPGALIRSLKLAEGRKIGLCVAVRTGAGESDWVPSGGASGIKSCTLVSKKMAALRPLEIGFDLRDYRIARGEELSGRFHLTNTGAGTVDAKYFVIAGEGRADAYLSSQKIRLDGIPPKKHITHDVRSVIPSDMPLGSWAIGAEARSGDGRLGGALVSFDVVEPFDLSLRLPEKPVPADVKDVTFSVVISNNKRGSLRGTAKITLPVGWELWRDADVREFYARGGAMTFASFKAKPPLGAIGGIPVRFDVTADGESKSIEGSFEVVNP